MYITFMDRCFECGKNITVYDLSN